MKQLLLVLALAGASLTQAAPLTYNFSVNTSTIAGTSGIVSFQLGSTSSDLTTATISPPFSLILTADIANPLAQGGPSNFLFGSTLDFVLTLSGPAIEAPTDFLNFPRFSLQIPALSSTELIVIEVVPGIGPLETFDPLVSQIPEPGTAWLFLLAAPVLARRFTRR